MRRKESFYSKQKTTRKVAVALITTVSCIDPLLEILECVLLE